MSEPPNRDILLVALERERSIRRTVRLLSAKRSRVLDDLDRLVSYLFLLVAVPGDTEKEAQSESELLLEAVERMEDPIFRDLLIKIIQAKKK